MKNDKTTVARPTVLIVDDDPEVRKSLAFSLGLEGYTVRPYTSAVDLLNSPDFPAHGCLVLDYRLSDMNGLELLKELRRRNVTLPALLITTHPSMSLRTQARAAGVPLIEKPLLDEALFDGIRAAIERI